jgi:hypothetical protein
MLESHRANKAVWTTMQPEDLTAYNK